MSENTHNSLIKQIIKEPLKLENDKIVDEEHEEYAVIQKEKLLFLNGEPLSIDISNIESIEKESKGIIKVRTAEGIEQFYESKLSPLSKPLLDHDGSRSDLNKAIDYILIGIDRYLYRDTLKNSIVIDQRVFGDERTGEKNLTDTDITNLIIKFEIESKRVYGKKLRFSRDTFCEVLELKAERNQINSFIRDIERIKWDRIERINLFMSNMKAATGLIFDNASMKEYREKESNYLIWLSRAIFLSVIERQFENRPIQFMPILIGEQQCGKSLLCEKLGLGRYYTSLPPSFRTDSEQKYLESVKGSVISEIKEGLNFKGHEDEIKSLLDKTEIQCRLPYQRMPGIYKLNNILIMTTNHGQILTDITGNRRFFPAYIKKMPSEDESPIVMADDYYFKQLWAEALELYKDGSRWYDDLADHKEILELIRSNIISEPEGFDDIRSFLDECYGNPGDKVTNVSIKKMLIENGYSSKKDYLMKCFKDRPEYFGFTKYSNKSMKDTMTGEVGKGFQRIKKLDGWDRSSIVQWDDDD